MEVIVKTRLLLTSALLMFAQIPAAQAQVTVDVVKITCQQLLTAALPLTSRDVILWLSGYYHREHNNTIIELDTLNNNEDRLPQEHGIGEMKSVVCNQASGGQVSVTTAFTRASATCTCPASASVFSA